MLKLLSVIILIPFMLISQEESESTGWDVLRYFEGKWMGEGKGKSGNSKLEREYRYILGGKYLYVVNRAEFEPLEGGSKGEVHENIDYYSYDRIRGKVVLRQFHIEGFVNRYIIDSLSTDKQTLIFETEHMENMPDGWKARITIKILTDDEFLEYFDLAAPDKEFGCYIENRFKRMK